MKCLIIAAGAGSRMASVTDCKPLLMIRGRPLIEHVIRETMNAGMTEFVVITGYNSTKLNPWLSHFSQQKSVKIDSIYNDRWHRGNGISVLQARDTLDSPFLLVMSDHLFDGAIVRTLLSAGIQSGEVRLAVDFRISNHPWVDMDDVTRVQVEDDKIKDIGKHLTGFNAFDTGIFFCTPGIFEALEESIAAGDESLSGGIRCLAARGKALACNIGDCFWLDIDDEQALNKVLTFENLPKKQCGI